MSYPSSHPHSLPRLARLGPGGVPYNIFGWLVQSLVGATISNETLFLADPAVFANLDLDKDNADHVVSARTSFLDAPLPFRAGPTPLVPGTVAPQRQITLRTTNAALLADMHQYLQQLAESNRRLPHLNFSPRYTARHVMYIRTVHRISQ